MVDIKQLIWTPDSRPNVTCQAEMSEHMPDANHMLEHMLNDLSENISDELSHCMPVIVLHDALSTYANACVSVRMSE